MHTKRVRWFCWSLLTVALIALALPALGAEKQVAVVNGSDIGQSDLDSEMSRVMDRLRASGRSPSPAELDQIRNQVLENLIARELLYQEAQKQGIKVDSKDVTEQFEALKQGFSNEAEFKSALTQMNYTEAKIKSQLERDLAIKQLIEDHIAKKVTVSDKEVKDYYDNNPQSFKRPEQVRASHILIKVDPEAEESQKAEARKKIEAVQQKLQNGQDFGALAKESSEGPTAAKGGDLGYFGRGQMVKPFEEKAFAMKPGDVSNLVETQFGYHLIKVTDRKPESTISYEEVKDRLTEFLKQGKVRKEISLYVANLESKAKIERFPKES